MAEPGSGAAICLYAHDSRIVLGSEDDLHFAGEAESRADPEGVGGADRHGLPGLSAAEAEALHAAFGRGFGESAAKIAISPKEVLREAPNAIAESLCVSTAANEV